MHIHASFLTPLLVFFSMLIVVPAVRIVTQFGHKYAWAQGLAFASIGF